jgi:hypothetical protein
MKSNNTSIAFMFLVVYIIKEGRGHQLANGVVINQLTYVGRGEIVGKSESVDMYVTEGVNHIYSYIYLEHHSVCPLVRTWTPHPLSRKRVCPLRNQRGEGTHSPGDKRMGVPIRTTREKA